jgi:putative flippase GtrA
MNTLLRWGKFNLVGAMGMGLQLAALALFNRWMAGHYLYASAAAIELTLLHNFMWHLHYTWRDRRDGATRLSQFVRFRLSNGLVSMLGNLALMRLLVHDARLPLLLSNVIAILCCSVANFCLGNNWAFAEAHKAEASCKSEVPRPMSIHSLTLALPIFLMSGAMAHAQTHSGPSCVSCSRAC